MADDDMYLGLQNQAMMAQQGLGGLQPSYGILPGFYPNAAGGSANGVDWNAITVTVNPPEPRAPAEPDELAWLKRRVREIEWRP